MKIKPLTKMLAALATLVLLGGTAGAALQAVGPTSAVTTLPTWYQDTTGLALELCIDQTNFPPGRLTSFCVLPPNFDPDPTVAPFRTPPNSALLPITTTGPIADNNFPDEIFYWLADSEPVPVAGGDQGILRMALEAAFLTGVSPNTGITFLRVNLKSLAGLPPNQTYTVNYPYGSFQITTNAQGIVPPVNGQAFRLEDPALGAVPGVFFPPTMQSAATTGIGPFLRTTGPSANLNGFVQSPDGKFYVGDPTVPTEVVGGTNLTNPTGANTFSIRGPGIATGNVNVVETVSTKFFTLSGKVVGLLLTPPAGGTDFGPIKLNNTSAIKSFSVQNLTGAALTPTLAVSNPLFTIIPNTCGAPVNPGATCTFDVTFTPVADGAQSGTVTVSTPGVPSVTSSVSGTGDGVAPTLVLDPVIPFTKLSTQTISGTVTDNSGVGSVVVTVNGVAQTPIVAPAGTTSFIWTKLITLTNLNASNSISVTATDTAQPGGNISAAQTATITNDTINPVVAITAPAAGLSNNKTPNLSFTATDTNLSFTTVTVDNVGVTPVPATLGPLADGLHTVRVDAGDSAGNSGTATSSFEVDATPPVISVTSPTSPNTGKASPILTFDVTDTHSDPTKTVVKVDGVIVPNPVSGTTALGPFAPGVPHTLTIDATDLVGNAAPTKTVPFTVILADGSMVTLGASPPTIADALLALRVAVGLDTTILPGSDKFMHGDVAPLTPQGQPNPNGVIDISDALTILRKVVGLITF